MQGQLRKLKNGIHPKSGRALPAAVEVRTEQQPHYQQQQHQANHVAASSPRAMDAGANKADNGETKDFYFHEPEVFPELKPSCSLETASRSASLLERIRAIESIVDRGQPYASEFSYVAVYGGPYAMQPCGFRNSTDVSSS